MKEIILALLFLVGVYVLLQPKAAGHWVTEVRQGFEESADAGTEQPRAAPPKTDPAR